MAGKQLRLKIITPARVVFDADVSSVILRTVEGDMGVLPGHEPCAVQLDYGVLRIFTGGKQSGLFAVLGGFATLFGGGVTVLSPMAEHPEQIGEVLARLERERAESRLREQKSELELRRAEIALRRALMQMDLNPHFLFGEEKVKEE